MELDPRGFSRLLASDVLVAGTTTLISRSPTVVVSAVCITSLLMLVLPGSALRLPRWLKGFGRRASASLQADRILSAGEYLRSRNGSFRVEMQIDGNLVLRDTHGSPLRSTGTDGTGKATYLAMQGDGNVVLQRGELVLGATDTHGGTAMRLVLQDDGRLVLRDWLGQGKSLNVPGIDVIEVLARDVKRRQVTA